MGEHIDIEYDIKLGNEEGLRLTPGTTIPGIKCKDMDRESSIRLLLLRVFCKLLIYLLVTLTKCH